MIQNHSDAESARANIRLQRKSSVCIEPDNKFQPRLFIDLLDESKQGAGIEQPQSISREKYEWNSAARFPTGEAGGIETN